MAGVTGRPSTYNKDDAKEIIDRISDGESLNTICKDENLPSRRSFIRWVLADKGGLSPQYEEACQIRALGWAEEVIDIADNSTNDYMDKEDNQGGTYSALNPESLARSRLRVDSRKWILSKLLPKYSDKPDITVSDQTEAMTEIMKALVEKLPD